MYSHIQKKKDTPAEKMENQIPEEVKEERRDEIMELQQEIAFDFSEKYDWKGYEGL